MQSILWCETLDNMNLLLNLQIYTFKRGKHFETPTIGHLQNFASHAATKGQVLNVNRICK